MRTKKELDAAVKAIRYMHDSSKGARLLTYITGRKITRVSVFNWMKRGIPPAWADDIYSITGIPPWVSNPEVFPARLKTAGYNPVLRISKKAKRFIDNGFRE